MTTGTAARMAAIAEAAAEAAALREDLGCEAAAWEPRPGSVEARWESGLLLIGTPAEIRAEAARRGITPGSAT